MKAFNLMFTSVLLCFAADVTATDYQFVAADNSSTTKLCMAAVTNDMQSLKYMIRHIRQPHEKTRNIANSVMCNNQIIANFSKTYNALETFTYLNKYTANKYKKLQSNITITDLTAVKTDDKKEKTVVILVASR